MIDPTICEKLFSDSDSEIEIVEKEDSYQIILLDSQRKVAHLAEADASFSRIVVSSSFKQTLPFEGSVGETLFRTALLFHDGIVLHSAAVKHHQEAVVFSAPSGTGKSTQAALWRDYFGAEVLNGDRAALRITDGVVEVHGTLWSGSSPEYKNDKAPVKGIVMLEQAAKNEIKRLSVEEAVQSLLPRCFLPFGSPKLMERALDNMDQIIRKTPIYRLRCRPDYEAAKLTSECLNMFCRR